MLGALIGSWARKAEHHSADRSLKQSGLKQFSIRHMCPEADLKSQLHPIIGLDICDLGPLTTLRVGSRINQIGKS
jgi:hypothetical protein